MVKKTIPQLQEATDITDNAFFVVDTGSVTKKIKKINIQRSFKDSVRTISTNSQVLTTDDNSIVFDSPDAPGTMEAFLPEVSDSVGKELKLVNKNTGTLTIYPNAADTGALISGNPSLDMTGIFVAHGLFCDGTNWYIYS